MAGKRLDKRGSTHSGLEGYHPFLATTWIFAESKTRQKRQQRAISAMGKNELATGLAGSPKTGSISQNSNREISTSQRPNHRNPGSIQPQMIPKSVALYYPPPLIGEQSGARCGRCLMFNEEGRCAAVEGSINADTGVCGLYVHGDPEGSNFGLIGKDVAGYVENGPTHCGNCRYYLGETNTSMNDPDRIPIYVPSGPCEK